LKRRFSSALLALLLVGAACSAPADEPAATSDGIAALEEEGTDDAATQPAADGKKKKGDGSKNGGKSVGKSGGGKTGGKGGSGQAGGGSAPSGDAASGDTGGQDTASGDASAQAAAPIPAGQHEYATHGESSVSGNSEDLPETTTLRAEAPSGDEQLQVRDLRDSDGNGTVTETRVLYRPEGVFLTYVKVTSRFSGGLTDVREFRLPKPQLIAPTGAGPGFSRSFTMKGSGTRADVTFSAVRYERVKIGGDALETIVVKTRIEFSGALEGESKATSWFWDKHALVVKEQVATDVTNGPVRVRSQYRAVLKRLP